MGYRSNLEQVLSEGKFAITAEVGPPKGANPSKIRDKAEIMKGFADAFNVTDNQTAVTRLSSMGGCCILLEMGLEPVMQMTCRDRNRIALQSDVLGAASVGIKNMFFSTGDYQSFGNHPGAMGVYDLDSIQLIQVVKNMRDDGVFQSGDKILSGNPYVFIGAAANPFADPFEFRVDRLEKKVDAGVDFIQTQSIFNIDKFNLWMDGVCSRGLDKRVHILAGITPLKSLKMIERMKFHVPGVDVPDDIYERMKNASDPKDEGFRIALELISELKDIKGVHGLHISAIFWEDIVPSLVTESNLISKH